VPFEIRNKGSQEFVPFPNDSPVYLAGLADDEVSSGEMRL